MTLTEFLMARISEDEARARDAFYEGQRWIPEEEAVVAADRDLDAILFLDRRRDAVHAARWSPARVLAECEAKRRIVETAQRTQASLESRRAPANDAINGHVLAYRDVVRQLAVIYADHPDYRKEWRP
jgi:hypothetical protein